MNIADIIGYLACHGMTEQAQCVAELVDERAQCISLNEIGSQICKQQMDTIADLTSKLATVNAERDAAQKEVERLRDVLSVLQEKFSELEIAIAAMKGIRG